MNDSVLAALLAALEQNENDLDVLLHVADYLLGTEQHEQALTYYQRVLALNPLHEKALKGGHQAALQSGQQGIAEGYKTLQQSLGLWRESADVCQTSIPPVESSNTTASVSALEPAKRTRGAALKLVTGGESLNAIVDVEDSHLYLSDVGGMDEVKRMLNLSFLAPLKNPEIMQAYGKNLSGGLLLYGPPGCGKTYIARALAGELGAKFISVGLTDILDMYIGESERKLHEIFEEARRNTPAVLFFDELDALGQKRNQLRNSGTRSLVNQLLAEMDSLESNNTNLFVLGATNHPWDIDSALRRPGRFDRVVPVFPPDAAAREAILTHHLKAKPTEDIDVAMIAGQTENFSGADLRFLCDATVELAIEKSMATGEINPLTTDDFRAPLQQVKPSTLSWFETARNFAMFANESGAYDELLNYIRIHKL